MAAVNLVINGRDETSSAFKSVQSSVEKTTGSLSALKGAAEAAAAAFGAYKFAQFAEQSTMMAARNETLAVVMKVVGQNAGYTADQMNSYSQSVAKMGITVEESRSAVIHMTQANLNLSQSSELARVAQNAAVIAGMNSSQALAGIMNGITTLQPEVLRTYGLVVNFEQAYAKAAATMGKSAEMLTQNEKQQIALNAVLEQGKQIAGSYEASLGTVGKAIYSLQRYISDNKAAFGELFTPALKVIVDEFTQQLKNLGDWFLGNKDAVKEFTKTLADDVVSGMRLAKEAIGTLYDVIQAIPDKISLIETGATIAGIALAGMATSAIVGSVVNLINKFVQLRAAILGAAAAQVALNGGAAAGGVAAVAGGAAAAGGLGVAGTAGLVATVGLGAYWLASKAMEGMGFDGGKAEYEEALKREKEAEARWNDALAKKAKVKADKANEAAAEAGNLEQARRKTEEAAFLQRQMDKQTYDARMSLREEEVKFETTIEKNLGETKLSGLKIAYDQGLIYASNYYAAVKEQALQTLQAELDATGSQQKRLNDQLSNNRDLTPVQKIKTQQDIIGLRIKENDLLTKYAEKVQTTNAQEINDLKIIHDLMLDAESARLTAAERYSQVAQIEIDKEKESINYLQMQAAAASGNYQAITFLYDKELSQQIKLTESKNKEAESLRTYTEQLAQARDGILRLAGASETMITADINQREGLNKTIILQEKLNVATLQGNTAAIQSLQAQINLQSQLNQRMKDSLPTLEAVEVLMSNIVGFNGNTPIYANGGGSFSNGVAVPGYVSPSDQIKAAADKAAAENKTGSSGFFNTNVIVKNLSDPFMGGFAVGTNYVPNDGYAFIHKGEAIVPEKYNPAAGGASSPAIKQDIAITINVQGGNTNAETADVLARKLYPILNKLARLQSA